MTFAQRFARLIHPRIYRLGMKESCDDIGMTYGHPDTRRSIAYDLGRTAGEQLTPKEDKVPPLFTKRGTAGPFISLGKNFMTPTVHAYYSDGDGLWVEVASEDAPFFPHTKSGVALTWRRNNTDQIGLADDPPIKEGFQYDDDGSLLSVAAVKEQIESLT